MSSPRSRTDPPQDAEPPPDGDPLLGDEHLLGDEPTIRRVTGEFDDPDRERRYRLDLLQRNARTYWKISLGIAVGVPSFTLLDLAALGPGSEWLFLLAVRLTAGVIVLVVGLTLRDSPERFVDGDLEVLFTVGQLAVFSATLVVCAFRPDDAVTNALSTVVLAFAALVLVPARFRQQTAVVATYLAGFAVVAQIRFDYPPLADGPLFANLATALACGATMLSLSNRAPRRLWATAEREQATNERLNAELTVAGRLRIELQTLSRQDPLTTAANRREFLRVASTFIDSGGDAAEPSLPTLSILMIDADRFKSINDRYGHAVGDAALVALVAAARSVIRAEDLIARVGGEEFAILLPGLGRERAAEAAERVRQAISRMPRVPNMTDPITVSIGVSERVPGDTTDDLMARADEAMYRVKRDGGNAVAVDGGPTRPPNDSPDLSGPGLEIDHE